MRVNCNTGWAGDWLVALFPCWSELTAYKTSWFAAGFTLLYVCRVRLGAVLGECDRRVRLGAVLGE